MFYQLVKFALARLAQVLQYVDVTMKTKRDAYATRVSVSCQDIASTIMRARNVKYVSFTLATA